MRRRLTVSRLEGSPRRRPPRRREAPVPPVPFIRMRGRWLAEAGFAIGDRLQVEVGEGELVVRREEG